MKISKFQNIAQRIIYSRPYRAPAWLWNRINNNSPDPKRDYLVQMRLGHSMQIRPTQNYLKNIIHSRQYHDENVFLLNPFLKKGSVVLDIGANIGLYSCAYSQYFKNLDLKIYAIEALENNYKQIKKNIDLNNFRNIFPFYLALGNENGILEFNLPSEDFVGNIAGSNVDTLNKSDVKISVPMFTLDHFAKENSIESCDFLKIDIEGAEYWAFEGGLEFLKKTRPVIQTEYNRYWLGQVGKSFEDFYKLFQPLDYVFAIEKEDSYEVIPQPESFKIVNELVDLLFIPKEKL